MLAELAYAAVVAILVLSAFGLSVWAGASIIYKIRDSRLEEMSPDPVEYEDATPPVVVDYYPTGQELPKREYAVSKPLPMPKGAELEHLCFEQAKENFKVNGQLVSDMIEEVQGRNFDDTSEEREFFEFAQKEAENNDPKLYEQLKPDTEYTFDPNIALWDLAREYQSLSPDDFNAHLRAICLVLKYFPRSDSYLKDPFYFQMQQMQQQLAKEQEERGGSAKLVEKQEEPTPEKHSGTIKAIMDLTAALEEAAKAKPATPTMVIKTADVSEETIAKVRKQFNEQASKKWVEMPTSKPKKSKKRRTKRSFAFEDAIKKPVRKRTSK